MRVHTSSAQLEVEIGKLEDEFEALECSFQALQALAQHEARDGDVDREAVVDCDAYAGLPCLSPVNLLGTLSPSLPDCDEIQGAEPQPAQGQGSGMQDTRTAPGSDDGPFVAHDDELHSSPCVVGGNIWVEAGKEGNPAECKREGHDEDRFSPPHRETGASMRQQDRARDSDGKNAQAPACVVLESAAHEQSERSKWGVTLALPASGQPRRVTPCPSNLKRSPSAASESSVASWARMLGNDFNAMEAQGRYRTLHQDYGQWEFCHSPASEQGSIRILPTSAATPRTRSSTGWQGQSWRWWSAAAPVGTQGSTSPVSPSSPSASAASSAAESAASFTAKAAAKVPRCLAKLAAAASCSDVNVDHSQERPS